MRIRRAGALAAILASVSLAAATAPPSPAPSQPAPLPPARTQAPPPPPPPPAIRHASTAAIVEQFLMLAYDADPDSGIPARGGLARWTEEQRVFVSGDPADQAAVDANAAVLSRLTGLPMFRVQGGRPNVFLAVSATPADLFSGPLRPLLLRALAGEDDTVERFIAAVVARVACWVLPVWADPARHEIKAAVIGIDSRQGRAGVARCITRELAASLGLLGPALYLPRSVFTPRQDAARLSFEDQLMLRTLYHPALTTGMTRDQAAPAVAGILRRLRPRVSGPAGGVAPVMPRMPVP